MRLLTSGLIVLLVLVGFICLQYGDSGGFLKFRALIRGKQNSQRWELRIEAGFLEVKEDQKWSGSTGIPKRIETVQFHAEKEMRKERGIHFM